MADDDVVWGWPEPAGFSPVGLTRTLVDATTRGLRGADCGDLTQARDWRSRDDDRLTIPADRVGEVNAEVVAEWVTRQYGAAVFPGIVIGTAHGSAAYLATALGVPWLPTGFDLDVGWLGGCLTDGAAAFGHGWSVAGRIQAGNHGVLVRQVHDPVRMCDAAGGRVRLTIRWSSLPRAFRAFLDTGVAPGGFALLVRDLRSCLGLDTGDGYTFQVGSSHSGLDLATYTSGADLSNLTRRTGCPATWPTGRYRRVAVESGVEPGIEAGLRQWARDRDGRTYSILYNGGDALSAAVADIYRDWLRDHGKRGDRLLVSGGRLLDPWHTIRAGLVPYWCEAPTRTAASAAELWLVGSRAFATIDVLPEPPGATWSQLAPMAQWSALARFAAGRGMVNPTVGRAYPLRALAPRYMTDALRGLPYDLPAPRPLRVESAVAGLRSNAPSNGILVSYGAGD